MSDPILLRVALDVPLPREFDYAAPVSLPAGSRVEVPFGPRRLTGIVTGPGEAGDFTLREAAPLADALPPLPADWLALVRFAAEYYAYPFGQALFTALPPALREARPFVPHTDPVYRLTPAGRAAPPAGRSIRQRALFDALQASDLPLSAARTLHPQAARQLADWLAAGRVETVEHTAPALQTGPRPALTPEQEAALAALPEAGFAPALLFGVTGSGKTELYLRRIEATLAAGRQALVLVPEINLTPQLEARFRARFPATPMAILTSHQPDRARSEAWVAAWQGRARLVIGTRLAVFTPLPELGLIVVDEEHDASFKQQDGLRYSARDLAVWRAHQASVPVILGSATPSLESWQHARDGRYRLIELTRRATGASLPEVRLIDIRRLPLEDGLSPPARQALVSARQRGEISMVFVNRRGYAPALACSDCGWIAGCPHCAVKLVLHLRERRLRCHHCGHNEAIPLACPDCGNPDIKPLGQGTQRIEAALHQLLPGSRIRRIDRDTVSHRDAWDDIYREVHAGEVDVLVGTQMLAKGHDFPALSTVVALNVDGGLYSPDFRASEMLFAQLLQVAGRAGRAGIPGTVWVQTQLPEHPLYQALVRQDYPGFAASLLQERQETGFPPFCHQFVLRADAPQRSDAMAFLQQISTTLPLIDGVTVFDPMPATLTRLEGRERAELLVQADRRPPLRAMLAALTECAPTLAKPFGRHLRWSIDVDPCGL